MRFEDGFISSGMDRFRNEREERLRSMAILCFLRSVLWDVEVDVDDASMLLVSSILLSGRPAWEDLIGSLSVEGVVWSSSYMFMSSSKNGFNSASTS